ncbi:MAG: DASH family cryptochrome [Alcaligenaceae bacterium]|nr:DASH family cryptochrome [Alcaligenaceae bacterium]
MIAIYWFRNDLRLCDQPSFRQACEQAARLAPVFIHDTDQLAPTLWDFERVGPHRKYALRSALQALKVQLRQRQSDLLEYQGDPCQTLIELAKHFATDTIFCEEIAAPEEQLQVVRLRKAGLTVNTFWHSSLLAPHDLPFAIEQLPLVFTEFRVAVEKAKVVVLAPEDAVTVVPPLPDGFIQSKSVALIQSTRAHFQPLDSAQSLDSLQSSDALVPFESLISLDSLAQPDARSSLTFSTAHDFAGTQGGLKHIQQYFERRLAHSYKATRNQLSGLDYSTKFSVWLASGALSARMLYQQLQAFEAEHGANDGSYWIWFELLWRDYFRFLHLRFGAQLYCRSGLRQRAAYEERGSRGGKPQFNEGMAQAGGAVITTPAQAQQFKRWCLGECGEPFIDAGMRELRHTGYLSNRLRQVVASYLIHNLKLDWRAGAAWFESQLIDYDVYSNQGNWLYIAGLGTDPRGGRAMRTDKQANEHDHAGTYRKQWGTL